MTSPVHSDPVPTLDTLIGHLIDMLPDSFSRRKKILLDILAVLDVGHPLRRPVEEMLHFLEGHEQHQLQLPILFAQSAATDPAGNGQPQP